MLGRSNSEKEKEANLSNPKDRKTRRSLNIGVKVSNQTPHIWKVTMLRKTRKRLENYRQLALMLAMFFLPLGYDGLFALLMQLTGSFWITDLIFYGISASFFISYYLLSKYLSKRV